MLQSHESGFFGDSVNWCNSRQHYGLVSVALHWLMVLLLIAVYSCIELRELYPKGSDPREAFKAWHFMLGLTVFALVWIRLIVQLLQTRPEIFPPPAHWQILAGRSMHVILYFFMIAMPLMGWLVLSGSGKPVPFFGTTLPALMPENETLAKSIKEVHETIGKAGYFLIALHALAGLFHHYILRDNALLRIMPKKFK
ncbi:cytochrome b [Porticoccus sp.]|uniref:cytochrome b n=1 Tax=Porticoccus sp. TaxID=2024853 RepID=UPI003F6A1AC8